jgi:SAM-dependent methyltransferase
MLDMKRIDGIAYEIDAHLRKLESFMGVLKEVKESINALRESQEKQLLFENAKIRRDMAELSNNLKKYGLPQASEYEKSLEEIRKLLETEEWPYAVEPHLLCVTNEDKQKRADSIMDLLIGERMKNKRFLDFGCGEGHTIPAALTRECSLAIGYDVDASKYQFDQNHFAENFDLVKCNAPFDIILMHDVLDHISLVDPIEALRQASGLLSGEGRIYIRNHPWSSRHGSHLYTNKNKAFIHLILDDIELMRCLGLQSEPNIKVVNPLETYRHWFKESGLFVKNEFVSKTSVEDFFVNYQSILDRLCRVWQNVDVLQSYMEIDFVDYVLEMPSDSANKQIY